MKSFHNVMAVIEPKRDYQEALARAVALCDLNPSLRVTALRVVYDYSNDMGLVDSSSSDASRRSILEGHLRQLRGIIAEYAGDHAAQVEPRVCLSHDIAQGILSELQATGCDLVLKAVNHHGRLGTLLFTPIDWHLLRRSPVPVIIAKNRGWQEHAAIVVALDFTSNAKKLTNLYVLRLAQIFARASRGIIHLVNSAPVMTPSVMLEVPHYAPEDYTDSVMDEHRRRLSAFAEQHHIPKPHCHVMRGMPDDVIPSLCQELGAKAVFIGSAGRTGVMAALVGNTCEEIVDNIDADLFVVNFGAARQRASQEQAAAGAGTP